MQNYDDSVCLVTRNDGILTVFINRAASMNSLTPHANRELSRVFDDYENDPTLRVAILTGAGSKAFSAGNDLKFSATASKEELRQPTTGFAGLTGRYHRQKPVIAAVNGYALGGGFEIALACDIIIAADTASFALPEPKRGLAALAGGMHRLPRQIPLKQAMRYLLTGDSISAHRAYELGFVSDIVTADELMDYALKMARKIEACAPISIAVTLEAAQQGLREADLEEAVKMDRNFGRRIVSSADFREGAKAFAEKRAPQWKGE